MSSYQSPHFASPSLVMVTSLNAAFQARRLTLCNNLSSRHVANSTNYYIELIQRLNTIWVCLSIMIWFVKKKKINFYAWFWFNVSRCMLFLIFTSETVTYKTKVQWKTICTLSNNNKLASMYCILIFCEIRR